MSGAVGGPRLPAGCDLRGCLRHDRNRRDRRRVHLGGSDRPISWSVAAYPDPLHLGVARAARRRGTSTRRRSPSGLLPPTDSPCGGRAPSTRQPEPYQGGPGGHNSDGHAKAVLAASLGRVCHPILPVDLAHFSMHSVLHARPEASTASGTGKPSGWDTWSARWRLTSSITPNSVRPTR